jgi:transcriptional regulator with XRE-family HTH domain
MTRNEMALLNIKELYKKKEMSIESFAKLIGKSKSAWLRRESGEVPLTLDEIDFIAEKIGSEFGAITESANNTNIHNMDGRYIVANSGGSITINLNQEQLQKVIDKLY